MPVTLLFMLAWAMIYVIEFQLDSAELVEIQRRFGLLPRRFLHGLESFGSDGWSGIGGALPRFWEASLIPLFTYQFLHADILHLLGNLLFFWVFASRLETRFGSLRFFLFFVLSGAVAGLFQVYLGSQPRVSTIGASGGIAGTMSAYMILFFRSRILLLIPVFVVPIFVEIAAPILALGWFVLQFRPVMKMFGLGPGEPIAWLAHIGGFLAGIALIPLGIMGRKNRHPERSTYGLRAKPWRALRKKL